MATESLIVELDAKTAKLEAKLDKTNKNLDNLDNSAEKAGVSLKKMAGIAVAGATAAAAAITSLTITSAEFAKQIQVAAIRANATVEEMQRMSFAAETVGISLEKLGDISKDTNERIGEFLTTGGGTFVDFVDVMGLGTVEARELAKEFQKLSGPQVLERMISMMEKAGVSGNRMSFALEGMASDATDLIPLLSDNAKELERLTGEFDALGVTLSQEQIDKIQRVGEEMRMFTGSFSASGRQLIADYADEIIAVVNAIEFLGTKIIQELDVIATGWGNIIEVSQAALNDLVNGTDTLADVIEERAKLSNDAMAKFAGEEAQKPLEVLVTKGVDANKTLLESDKLTYKQRLDIFSKYTKAASAINNAFFEENKAIQAGIIVADTATGIMRAFATSSNIYEAYANAAVVAATGIAQLANLQSASKGGGSISEGSTSTGASSQPTPSSFEPETSDLSLTSQDEDNSNTFVVRFESDSSSDFIDALAGELNERSRQGRG